MMGRGFYSPLHSMWGATFGAAAAAKHYPAAFPYSSAMATGGSGNGVSPKEEDSSGGVDGYGQLASGATCEPNGGSFGASSPSSVTSALAGDYCKLTSDQQHQYASLTYGLPATMANAQQMPPPPPVARKMQEGTKLALRASLAASDEYHAPTDAYVYGVGFYPRWTTAMVDKCKTKAKKNAGKAS
jgi:hypothetical protein